MNTTEDRSRARRLAALAGCDRVLGNAPRPGIRDTLAQLLAEVGDDEHPDVYGSGPVRALEQQVAGLLGMPDAAFFPTGTMAQQAALRVWAGRTGNPAVALHPLAHPEVHERDALTMLTGLRTVHVTAEPRQPTAEEVRDLDEPYGTLMLELPLRDAGFVLPTWDELTETVAAARERDAVVHLDGARLWECTEHFGRTLPEIAGLADSVYVSFYKSLGGISGAALAASADVVAEAKAWRHRYGGALFQQYPAVLAARAGLRAELPRLASYVAHAKVVAPALRAGLADGGVPWCRVNPGVPHTHQFQLWLPYSPQELDEAAVRQAEQRRVSLFGVGRFRRGGAADGLALTELSIGASALEWTADDVRAAAAEFAVLLRTVAVR